MPSYQLRRGEPGTTTHEWGGWEWVSGGSRYRTDPAGVGLYRVPDNGGEAEQVQVGAGFHLPRTREGALSLLRRRGLAPDPVDETETAEVVKLNLRVRAGTRERLEEIAGQVGALARRGQTKGAPSSSRLIEMLAWGDLVVARTR